jgi:hypothetical protein
MPVCDLPAPRRVLRATQWFIVGLALLGGLSAGSAGADEVWVAPTYQADFGGVGIGSNAIWPVSVVGAVRFAWAVPDNLQTFQSAKIVLIPHSPGGATTLNVFVCPAENASVVTAACVGPFTGPFTGVANELLEVDVSAMVGPSVGAPGLSYLAVLAFTTPTTATDHIVGLRFAYAPTAPSGVATLGANTFSGTQRAPAFVGDGSGLTNLPAPPGVATLGTNVFGGTQTAPAFVGNGSGLTGLPFPTGAATLGANVFSGTQRINTGNLDLDGSTATTGNITKNGAPFLHNFGNQNTSVGVNAGNLTTTGGDNTASGAEALTSNTSGSNNTAIGRGALALNTTGLTNTALGVNALANNTTGGLNIAVGPGAGLNATTGSDNIYLGRVSGIAGESNTMYLGALGTQTRTVIAGVRGTTVVGGEPVVIDASGRLGSGGVSPGANTVGTSEVVNDSLTANDLAPNSVTASELAANSIGESEVAFNYAGSASEGGAATDLACMGCVSASEVSFAFATHAANTFVGTQTINTGHLDLDNSTGTTGTVTKNGIRFLHNFGTDNVFLGLLAGNGTMTGAGNAAIGASALFSNTSGSANTATGQDALSNNTTGFNNTATGNNALFSNTTGDQNAACGDNALAANTGGSFNTATGSFALANNTTGDGNTAIGFGALTSTTGGSNVAVGSNAGIGATTGSNNIYLGAGVFGPAAESNTTRLGLVQTKTIIAGIRGITTVNNNAVPVLIDSAGQLGTVSSSRRFKEDIHDMTDASSRLFKLRPVTFRYTQAYADGSKPQQYGLVAEEVAEVFPELAVRDADGQVETVHYETLNVLLLNELQKQQRRIEALEQRLNQGR